MSSGRRYGGPFPAEHPPVITIEIANEQSHVPLEDGRLRDAVRIVLERESVARARISLAVVDDPTIRRVHREYLEEDEPTDVLSFLLDRSEDGREGEVIVSGQTAASAAPAYGWTPEDELLLYVIHGALHLTGGDDSTPEAREAMRRREQAHLARFGVTGRYDLLDREARPLESADRPPRGNRKEP